MSINIGPAASEDLRPRIAVIGVGGAGGNAIANMMAAQIEGVEFIVVGAHALAAHGVVRASGDLDVLVRPTRDNARLVVQALRMFGAPLEQHGIGAEDFEREGTVYQLGLPPRRIDLLTKVSGLTFDEAADEGAEVDVAGVTFRVPSAEALLVNKRASGREKDLEDVPDNVKQGLKIIPVENVDEVLGLALANKVEPVEWTEADEAALAALTPPPADPSGEARTH